LAPILADGPHGWISAGNYGVACYGNQFDNAFDVWVGRESRSDEIVAIMIGFNSSTE
jgi:hypothetical protein